MASDADGGSGDRDRQHAHGRAPRRRGEPAHGGRPPRLTCAGRVVERAACPVPRGRHGSDAKAARARGGKVAAPRAGNRRRSSSTRWSPAAYAARGSEPRGSFGSSHRPWFSVLERIELRPHGRAAIVRRHVAADRLADRVAMQRGPQASLALRQALDEVQPTGLGPLLRPDHLGPPELALRRRAQARAATRTNLEWPSLTRCRWPSDHPA
jgi:hypothetical protein